MADAQYAEIKEKFSGSWKLDRSENFEEFLQEVGANYFVRKMAGMSKPITDISVEDGKITISLNAGVMKKQDTFKLGEPYETDFQGKKVKALASYEDGKLTNENQAEDTKIKMSKSTREITENGELLLIMYVGNVVCKRYFKRVTT